MEINQAVKLCLSGNKSYTEKINITRCHSQLILEATKRFLTTFKSILGY